VERKDASTKIEWLRYFQPFAIAVATTITLLVIMGWLDNLHMNTANGIFKSIQAEPWQYDPANAPLDPSNLLYFPLMGLLCRFFDFFHVHAGQIWRQLAVINSISGGIVAGITYWFVLQLTNQRIVALFAAIFHIGCAFVLTLSIENEDILPSYMLVYSSMVLAGQWFSRPSLLQVFVVAALFTFSWLMEWRLMFPILPPLMLSLAVADCSIKRRIVLSGLFLISTLAIVACVYQVWRGHSGAVDLVSLFWTGKGVGSGWSGFSNDKIELGLCGIGEYLLGGRNCAAGTMLVAEVVSAIAIEAFLLGFLIYVIWQRRRYAPFRALAIIFLGAFAVGELMNAYSQPADPQMQINVMPWLTLALAFLLSAIVKRTRMSRFLKATALVAVSIPFAYNVYALAPLRGQDTRMQDALAEVAQLADPSHTVFFYLGWEQISTWQFFQWSHNWAGGICDLNFAPIDTPKFKWISILEPVVRNRSLTASQHAEIVDREIQCAFDKGYRVVAGPVVWSMSQEDLGAYMSSLNARDHAAVIYDDIHKKYDAQPIGGPAIVGRPGYSELRRR